jgi:hypothetical protein
MRDLDAVFVTERRRMRSRNFSAMSGRTSGSQTSLEITKAPFLAIYEMFVSRKQRRARPAALKTLKYGSMRLSKY